MSITQLVSQYLLGALLSLVVITNPLSKIPMFISLTTHDSRTQRARVALDACLYAGGIMVVSLVRTILFPGNCAIYRPLILFWQITLLAVLAQ